MLIAAITTIQQPTRSVTALVEKLVQTGGSLIVAGDKKGPANFSPPAGTLHWPVEFLSLLDQQTASYGLGSLLPVGHYARKNIAYLAAVSKGARCIYETDDDNAPNEHWVPRDERLVEGKAVPRGEHRWVNVYDYFSTEKIWPRGLPLDEIRNPAPEALPLVGGKRAPIQQGLVNGSPDVDAIWRLVMERDFSFDQNPSVYLESGNWCPFNTQSTWWWPVAFPLLYIPSYCSFRMCDIWKSFVAQRCLWELDLGVAFHAAEVDQDRNFHDLTRDFRDEIPGYCRNAEICQILAGTELARGEGNILGNLSRCYSALIAASVFPEEEMELVNSWIKDFQTALRNGLGSA